MTTTERMRDLNHRSADLRSARSALKREIKAGRQSAAAVIADPPAFAERMLAFELLLSVPGVGGWRVRRMLREAGVSELATLGNLPTSARKLLARAVVRCQRPRS